MNLSHLNASLNLFKVIVAKSGKLNLEHARQGFVTDFKPTDEQLTVMRAQAESQANPGHLQHEYNEDAVCLNCGFDGAEWSHWKKHTYEGKASDAKMPPCKTFYKVF